MFTILFVIISLIFIGLGLPDSLIGAAWPAVYQQLNLPISYANFVTVIISLGTVVTSFFSARLINKFGTGIVTAVSTAVSALSLLGFSFSNSMLWFCLLSVPLGAGAGAIDAALNNFVALHYNAMHMSFLHCFYGLGVAISPYIMSFALNKNNDWALGYQLVFLIQIIITLFAIFAIPLWNKVANKSNPLEQSIAPKTLSYKQMAKIPTVRAVWILLFTSVALEFTCGIWSCTYLVNVENMSEALSAKMLTLYYVGMTIGRLIAGFICEKFGHMRTVFVGYCVVAVAIFLLFLPIPPIVKGLSLFLIGFGNGPTFPTVTCLAPKVFGREVSQSIVSSQQAMSSLGILIVPTAFGLAADYLSLTLFPFVLAGLFAITLISAIFYNKFSKTHQKSY